MNSSSPLLHASASDVRSDSLLHGNKVRTGVLLLRHAVSCVALAIITSQAPTAEGQYFSPVDSRPYSDRVVDIATDVDGIAYAVGVKDEYGTPGGIIRVGTLAGSPWTDFTFEGVSRFDAVATGVRTVSTVTPGVTKVESTVVVAGRVDSTGQWAVFRKADEGEWTRVDDLEDTDRPVIQAAALDDEGTIYITATCTIPVKVIERKKVSTQLKTGWLVRRIPLVGKPTTVRLEATAGRLNTTPAAIACVGNTIYVAGTAQDRWQVWRSDDEGANWTLVDDFRKNELYRADARGIAVDANGVVYVVGSVYEKIGTGKWDPVVEYWFARKGNGSKDSFKPLDSFFHSALRGAITGVTVDALEGVHVTGFRYYNNTDGTTAHHWLTRSLLSGTSGWQDTDVLEGVGFAIAADPFGHVYSAGGTGGTDWVIRAH